MIDSLMRTIGLGVVVLVLAAVACGGDDGGDGDGDGDGDIGTAFRITTLNLRDPHTFALNGGIDVTNMVDTLISDGITMDADNPADGILDLSILTVFSPLDQAGASTPMQVVFADCTDPPSSTSCSPTADTTPVDSTATNGGDPCLDILPDTTTAEFMPPVALPPAPCFSSDAEAFDVQLGEIVLAMEDARIAGSYTGDPATQIVTGLIRGFVTQQTADAALIPDDVVLVGGMPVSSLLRDQDKDVGPGGADGWYFYLNFVADPVAFTP